MARKRSPNGARRLHSALSVMFGWLLRQRRVAVNPAVGVWRPGPPASRERVLSNAEVVIFWDACGRVGGTFGPLFKTLLLTGCRLREVSGMRRAEITDGVWTISGARTKNHRLLSLTLPLLVREIIHSIPVIEGKVEFVFTTNGRLPARVSARPRENSMLRWPRSRPDQYRRGVSTICGARSRQVWPRLAFNCR